MIKEVATPFNVHTVWNKKIEPNIRNYPINFRWTYFPCSEHERCMIAPMKWQEKDAQIIQLYTFEHSTIECPAEGANVI